MLIEPLGTNVSEISIGIQTFSFKKMHLNMSSAKWRPFCLGLNELNQYMCLVSQSRYMYYHTTLDRSFRPLFRQFVGTGRYTRPKTLLVNRPCNICNNRELEDEIHTFLRCFFYNDERSRLFKSLSKFSTVNWDSNLFTFKTLVNVRNGDYEFFKPVSTFINECFEKRKCVPIH